MTELVTGLDLVAEQLWIAAGAPLSDAVLAASAAAATPTRHAIEIRLSAEDPAVDFAPAPGRVGAWRMPAGPGIRVDTAIRPGDRVPPDYDPMIAKILAVGPDRRTAIDRLARALDETEVTGIQTTLPFDRVLVRDAAFRAADALSIDWVADRWDGTARRAEAYETAAAAAAAAASVAPASLRTDSADASDASPWRAAGRAAAIDRWPR